MKTKLRRLFLTSAALGTCLIALSYADAHAATTSCPNIGACGSCGGSECSVYGDTCQTSCDPWCTSGDYISCSDL